MTRVLASSVTLWTFGADLLDGQAAFDAALVEKSPPLAQHGDIGAAAFG